MARGEEEVKRKLEDWLDSYIDYTSEQESPSLFHLWVGLSMIASALERKVWIDRGYYLLYPNLYVVLVGASARVRRTTAVNIGYNLFKEALPNVTIVSQKTTPEALINIFVEEGRKRKMSGGTIVSTELGVFLGGGTRSGDIIQLLTDWYDCPKLFIYHTLSRGKEQMRNVYCNLIGSTTPIWLKESMPQSAIGGGFTSRIIFVYQSKPEKLVPFPVVNDRVKSLREKLIDDLREINKLGGEYRLSEEAREWYEEWYTEVFKPDLVAHSSLNGYYGRKHDTLLKVAMCVSASRKDELLIEEDDLKVALKCMNAVEKFLPQTVKLIQMTEIGEEEDKVFKAIGRRGEVDYTRLLRSLSYCMNAKRLQEVLDTLISEEKVEEFIREGRRWFKVKEG